MHMIYASHTVRKQKKYALECAVGEGERTCTIRVMKTGAVSVARSRRLSLSNLLARWLR